MPELVLAVILAIIFGFFGLSIFPQFHSLYSSVDTSEMIPIVAFLVKALPYIVLFAIIYTAILIVKRRVNH